MYVYISPYSIYLKGTIEMSMDVESLRFRADMKRRGLGGMGGGGGAFRQQ